jgi:hypothetical protein
MVFDLSANKLLSLEPSRSKILRKSFFDFVRGLISFPLYLPGTAYYSCMKVRTYCYPLAALCCACIPVYTTIELIGPFFGLSCHFQGRQSAMEVLQEVLAERKRLVQVPGAGGGAMETIRRHGGDFLDLVIQEVTKEKPLVTDRMALDLMFVLLFASFHTTSLALTLAVKLLADHPRVLEELTVRNMQPLIVWH